MKDWMRKQHRTRTGAVLLAVALARCSESESATTDELGGSADLSAASQPAASQPANAMTSTASAPEVGATAGISTNISEGDQDTGTPISPSNESESALGETSEPVNMQDPPPADSISQDSTADTPEASDECDGPGSTEPFSFFVTSLAGLQRLSGSPTGFGGDLRFGQADGLSGADEICRQLAEYSSPGAGCKTWRAFLSATAGPDGEPVHARDRIGEGPWYDRLGRLVAMNMDDLLQPWPVGADPVIMFDLPNEDGIPNWNPDGNGEVDNHNTITGTNIDGMLFSEDWAFTCHDWTSSVGTDGAPVIGFSWKGGAAEFPGSRWYSNSFGGTEGGCAAEINLEYTMDFQARGIGARGGYGGFYCLALEP